MREVHAQKRFWCRCSQVKREAGNAIEPVWNRRDCISGAVKFPILPRLLRRLLAATPFHRRRRAERLQSALGIVRSAGVSHTGPPEDRSGRAQPASAAALGLLDEGASSYCPRVLHLKRHRGAYGTCWALSGFDAFQWNGLWIGLSLGTFGICQTLVQALLPGPATKLLGERSRRIGPEPSGSRWSSFLQSRYRWFFSALGPAALLSRRAREKQL